MYVKQLYWDDYRNADDFENIMDSPKWNDAERIIDSMDGKNITQVILSDEDDGDNYLCIGGGNDGRYNVFISKDDNRLLFDLLNPIDDPNVYELVTGGQLGDFDGIYCVDKETAKKAARQFFETGKPDKELKWQTKSEE